MNDNLIKKYQKKESVAEKCERTFSNIFKGSCIALMGCILLRYAPHFPFTSLATAGVIASEVAIGVSLVGEFASNCVKGHYENKRLDLESENKKTNTPSVEISKNKELERTESHDNYRTNERDYGMDDIFTRSRPAVRQRMRKK